MMLAVLILATMFTLIATSFIFIQQAKVQLNRQLAYDGQTVNAAQAGLIDALSWFRRQQAQPVVAFSPTRDMSVNPPVNETDDAAIGLVREYEISDLGNVWGRYEVRAAEVQDVSDERGKDVNGTVWELKSHGITYVRKDSTKDYDEYPNSIITKTLARTEIQRLTLRPPANAAINVQRGDNVTTQSNTRIFGNNNIGIAYPPDTGFPARSGEVNAAAAESQVEAYNDSISAIFGVTQSELVAMADVKAASVAELPATLPAMSIVVIQGDARFTTDNPLIGVGVLLVFGDLTIDNNTASAFNGLIYVDGDYIQGAPSSMSGTLIITGDCDINGSSDFSEINYDAEIISQIQKNLGQYRFTRNQTLGHSNVAMDGANPSPLAQ